jgi:ABC-type transporter Mla MlaB component
MTPPDPAPPDTAPADVEFVVSDDVPATAAPTEPPDTHHSVSFIGTFVAGPDNTAADQAEVVLRGDLDAAAVDRVGEHIAALLRTPVRFLTIDAAAVDRVDPALLELLSRTQRRLRIRRGMIEVRGLHPSRLGPDERTR